MCNTAKKFLALCSMAVMLVLVASITAIPAFAAPNGIYTAAAHPHYRHPVTGAIEDSGGESSEVLGQSMTESATHKQALVEVDPEGNTFITVRLLLQDNVKGVSFSVDGAAVSAAAAQEGGTWTDYRMRVNSENSVIRCKMFVEPMGRDVVFYITVSGLTAGSGDFETFVEVVPAETKETEPKETEPKATEPKATEPKATEPKATEPKVTEALETKPAETTVPETTAAETTVPETTAAETTAPETTEVLGLQEFDASGDQIVETKAAEEQKDSGSMSTFL